MYWIFGAVDYFVYFRADVPGKDLTFFSTWDWSLSQNRNICSESFFQVCFFFSPGRIEKSYL